MAADWHELYEQGLKDQEIADRVGVSQATIWRRRNAAGLPPNGRKGYVRPLKQRFDEKWALDRETGCWVWTAAKLDSGYGLLRHKGTSLTAHRAAWMTYRGCVPNDKHVLHKNTAGETHRKDCVNPAHLYLGDDAKNCQDRIEAGTQKVSHLNNNPSL